MIAGAARQLQRYPGSKGADGVYHRIIGLMPPHDVYIEAFVGSGAILLHKKPARSSIVIDADTDVADYWRRQALPSTTVVHGDAIQLLRKDRLVRAAGDPRRVLVYCDPPYVRSARRSMLPLYRHEMSDQQHVELCDVLNIMACPVMLSGYSNEIYNRRLKPPKWRRLDFHVMTHAGPAIESLWLNYSLEALHDYRYLGRNFRERERIKRKQARWHHNLSRMPALERAAMLETLLELASTDEAVLEQSQKGLPL